MRSIVLPQRLLLLALLPLLGAPVCGGDDDGGDDGDGAGDIDGGGGGGGNDVSRFLGTWDGCQFQRRYEFMTPADHEDIYQESTGTIEITDIGDGDIRVTPSTSVAACTLDFVVDQAGSFANIIPGQSCVDDPYTISYSNLADCDVSTGTLACSVGAATFTGDGASGTVGGTYSCEP